MKIYEDQLPDNLTDEQYAAWFAQSEIVDGVRMGPVLGEAKIHCWQGYSETLEFGSVEWADAFSEMSKTCLLPDDHEGPHVWTDDDKIEITFL